MERKPDANGVTDDCPCQKGHTRRIRLAGARDLTNEKCAMVATEQCATSAPIPLRSRHQNLWFNEGGRYGAEGF
jgi:hypothetical protein